MAHSKNALKLVKIFSMAMLMSACSDLPPAPDYHPGQFVYPDKVIEYKVSDPLKLRFKKTGRILDAKEIDGHMCFPPEDIAASRAWESELEAYHQKHCK